MVGRLVEENDIGVGEHGAREREHHAPAAGELGAHAVKLAVVEANITQHLLNLLSARVCQQGVLLGVHEHVPRILDIVVKMRLNKHTDQLLRQALNLAVGNVAQQGGLARAVVGQHAVRLAAVEPELGVVQQDLAAVRKREVDVTHLLSQVLQRVGPHGNRTPLLDTRLRNTAELARRHVGLLLRHEGGEVGHRALVPSVDRENVVHLERGAEAAHVVEERTEHDEVVRVGHRLLEDPDEGLIEPLLDVFKRLLREALELQIAAAPP
mmetsp:Transcript_80319/g.228715  ORF Transcript_80319/g.228715 Transcript_80319/m.228715 type:complete len:267 (+) Transcript_80319:1080-1880(+)